MFTGIVEEVGRVRAVSGSRVVFEAHKVLQGTAVGDSLDVNGVCLTVTALGQDSFMVELMPETRRRTNLGNLRPGEEVNLERAVPLGGRLGGHLVQGHVDAMGRLLSAVPEEGAMVMEFSVPEALMSYVVAQGFIAVDGVSLTVVRLGLTSFSISLVTYTLEHTNLRRRRPGDGVNVEVDVLAKYVERLRSNQGINMEWLAQKGFLEVGHAA